MLGEKRDLVELFGELLAGERVARDNLRELVGSSDDGWIESPNRSTIRL